MQITAKYVAICTYNIDHMKIHKDILYFERLLSIFKLANSKLV